MDHDTTLAEIVTARPAAARVLERHGLDYCCGGRRALRSACRERGVDPHEVIAELADLGPASPPDWATMGPTALVDHIEWTHHAHLHHELPRLSALAAKVAEVHGSRHPELVEVRSTFEELRADLEPHLAKEERVLFPLIRQIDAGGAEGVGASVVAPVRVMLAEHDRAGQLLARLRDLTGGYVPPPDGCASYRALYAGLEELEADTHEHVHKENNLLFPAVIERQQS